MDIKEVVKRPEYNFLNTETQLSGKIAFLTFGGSHSYGTNIASSDIDIRGCVLNGKAEILGGTCFEHYVNTDTDTTLYGFNKLIGLLTECNPNTIEMLGCKKEHYMIYHSIGNEMLENRKMFLSRRAAVSFGGYANQQLRRLQNALARDNYSQAEKERHILGSVRSAMTQFEERYGSFGDGSIRLHIDESQNPELETEIFADVNLTHYPLRDYKNIWAEMHNIVKDYAKVNKRNHKKDEAHLNKHAMHLVRLYLMCIDILEKEEIITYREDDRELLLSIRNGKYQKEDKSYRSEFFELIDSLEKRVEYAKNNTALPEKPDTKRIGEFVISVNERAVRDEY